jgi:Flp pilus assembly protein TadG
MEKRQKRRRGAAVVEFALVGIVVIFLWIGVVQAGIGAWQYHTLQYSVKVAAAYMAMHGADCATAGNSCSIEIENAAQVLENAAVGIPPKTMSVTFTPYKSDHTTAAGGSYPVTCTLDKCLTNTTAYPPTGFGAPGSDIRIQASITVQPLMALMVPYAGSVQYGTYTFTSDTQQTVLF